MKTNTQGKYAFVPAGCFSINHGGFGIYIQYKKNPNKIEVKGFGPRHVWVSCPDRDLFLVADGHYAQQVRPMEGNYDEYVNLSYFNPMTNKDFDLEYYMMNYTQYIGKESKSPNNAGHETRKVEDVSPVIIADSGGFQIATGRLDYLDPRSVIDWYNNNVHVGLVLDIPIHVYGKKMYERSANIQKRNTDIMLESKRDSLDLMNIFHGRSLEERKVFRDICETPEITRLAVGGAYYTSVLQSISDLYQTITTGQKYKQYHVLGVANIRQVYLLMRIASQGVVPLITSDSSTYLQEAANKGYFVHHHIAEAPRYMKIGDDSGNRPTTEKLLPCNCAVCSSIKYMDVLSVLGGNVVTFMLMYHNLYAVNNFMRYMANTISELNTKDVRQLLKGHLSNRQNGKDETLKGLEFIDHIAADGFSSAVNKYKFYLNSGISQQAIKIKPLFGADSGEKSVYEIQDTLESSPAYKRALFVMSQYEKDDTVKHGLKDKKNKMAKGHTSVSSKGKAGPGSSKKKINKAKSSVKPKSKKAK